jgi:type IV secretory pathway component VirB8
MTLDTGTMIAVMIALIASCGMMIFAIMENIELKKTVKYLLKKDNNNG